ncbi:MAG: tetratricopeptide repeat protein [Phenylobacterium sp.]|nr:MAG: tetratricopeptide repeat protein [Phenylobacterium sp.]
MVTGATVERRLKAILAADVAGYSRLVAADEDGALSRVSALLRDVLRPKVEAHEGRIFKTNGDGFLAEFPGAIGALQCAVDVQRAIAERNAGSPIEQRLILRVGIHVAEVVVEDGDIFGDGVNIAARLEALAEPGGIYVSGRVQEDTFGRATIEFDDLGARKLKNIPRSVRVFRVRLEGAEANGPPALPLPDKPSIAVLPFENRSGDPEQEYFADAITEDIVTALARWRWFFVIGRNSSFAFKGKSVDATTVGRQLGVRYVLEGSVRKAGARVRITARLLEADTASPIWADSFDREMSDIFALQDEITAQVVAAIEPAMQQSEAVSAARKNLGDLDALDCFQRGMWHLNKVSEEGCQVAIDFFRQAIELDPDLALGHIGLARALYGRAVYGWSPRARDDLRASADAAQAAIRLDPRDAYAHFAASGAALYLGQHQEALLEARKTVALNPNLGFAHFRLGQVLVYAGRSAEAIEPIERSLRNSPYDPQLGAMLFLLAAAHYHTGHYEEAERAAENAFARHDARGAAVLAASLARLGRIEEARNAFPSHLQPTIALLRGQMTTYARPADREDLLDGLRLAGIDVGSLEGIS